MQHDVNVTRDGRWWMVEVPSIDGLTQARRIGEVEDQARSLIATVLDVPLSSVELGRVTIDIPDVGDIDSTVGQISHLRAEAAEAEATASKLMKGLARSLVYADIPMRDVGAILGVSHQRVAQLVE